MSIWNHLQLQNNIEKDHQISQGEGFTDLEELVIDGQKVYIKKEYQNPTGSFKDRSIAYHMSRLKEEGVKEVTISSSGNAAISAVSYGKLAGIKVNVFVSDNVEEKKIKYLEELGTDNFKVNKSKRPKSDAIKYSKEHNIPNIRGSQDDMAVIGFKTIAYELYEEMPEIDVIFIPCSSGTSTLGIYSGYQDLQKIDSNVKIPRIFIVQTEKIHPIAKEFDSEFLRRENSIAPAISDRVAFRKNQIITIISETNGGGFVISDDELREAEVMFEQLNFEYSSYNSFLAYAGYKKALKSNEFRNPCFLFSGR